jgi:hypothetical protein
MRARCRSSRSAFLAAFLAAWLASGACYSYKPVSVAPSPGSRVRIVFSGAIDVATFQPGRDSTRRTQPGVLEAGGTIQAAAADTVALNLGELRTAAGPLPGMSGQVALLPAARIARIEERRFQALSTALTGVGLAALALTAFLTIVIVAMTRGI